VHHANGACDNYAASNKCSDAATHVPLCKLQSN
jgi:hypothetical protein